MNAMNEAELCAVRTTPSEPQSTAKLGGRTRKKKYGPRTEEEYVRFIEILFVELDEVLEKIYAIDQRKKRLTKKDKQRCGNASNIVVDSLTDGRTQFSAGNEPT